MVCYDRFQIPCCLLATSHSLPTVPFAAPCDCAADCDLVCLSAVRWEEFVPLTDPVCLSAVRWEEFVPLTDPVCLSAVCWEEFVPLTVTLCVSQRSAGKSLCR